MSTYNINNLIASFPKGDVVSRRFEAGTTVFREGTPVSQIYFVIEGEVRVLRFLANGQEMVFFRAKGGSALSEVGLFVEEHPYDAVASADSLLASVQKEHMLKMLRTKPTFAEQFFFCMTSRYTEALMLREFSTIRSADDRLQMWFEWQVRMGVREFRLEGRTGTLGADLGLTRESVYRALARLEKRKFIERKGGIIRVIGSRHGFPEPSLAGAIGDSSR